MKNIRIAYWIFFCISIAIMLLNIGLFFAVSLIILIPIVVLHASVGLKIQSLKKYTWLVVISFLNLLLLALIRPDGTHTTTNIGWSVLLDLLGYDGSFNRDFESYYFYGAIGLMLVQVLIDTSLWILIKRNKNNL
ncbi:hypothetical protein [Kordia sp.]|uniref:hypothetical protein n=1 Tax=Kordia sp. TaxID=1965332 RepID=UPI003D6A875F